MTTGPEHYAESKYLAGRANHYTYGDGADPATGHALAAEAQVHATNAQTAAIVMLISAVAPGLPELEAWRDVIPAPPLKKCQGKEDRRPECAERHTDDCAYVDPVPEPKHELLPVGTRVLVSNWGWEDPDPWSTGKRKLRLMNPEPGVIVGYDLHRSKYRWRREWSFEEGRYSSHDQWAFADNRVEVHPDGPECNAEGL